MDLNSHKRRTVEDAKVELAARGMPFSEEHFLRYVRSGNLDTVALYLDAGISPNTSLDGESALALTVNCGHKSLTKMLLDVGADPMGIMEGLKDAKPERDGWDRLSSLTGVFTFVSSLLIAAVGWYFTNSYNERQLELARAQARQEHENKVYQNRLAEMQTVEKMIPHLTKDESSKQVALIAISALASPDIAARIAETYGGTGSINALAQLAKADVAKASAPAITALTNIAARELEATDKPAHQALANVLKGREKAIVKLVVAGRAICNGFVVDGSRGWVVTADYCFGAGVSDNGTVSVQFGDGSLAEVTSRRVGPDGLLAFLDLDMGPLPALKLSGKQLAVGSTISQIAFDLGTRNAQGRGELRVVLGGVVEVGDMSFVGFDGSGKDVKVSGLKVKLAVPETSLLGTGGGPLLDSEGNVACMTFMGDSRGNEQCVAALVISRALETLLSG